MLSSSKAVLSQAAGKGTGNQSVASGVYEAIEHAAMLYLIPGQNDPSEYNRLSDNQYLENKNMAYTELRQISESTPIQTLTFYEVSSDISPNLNKPILYPRILCDISMPLTEDLGNMLPYAAHSSNTGTASGNTWADAALHAINEALERDAESQFLLDQSMGRKAWVTFSLPTDHPMYCLFQELTGGYGSGGGALYLLHSISGYVVCAAGTPRGSEAELGFGASFYLDIAIERAITELQQIQYSISLGETWQGEGAVDEGNLAEYPNMRKIATRKFPIAQDPDIKYSEIPNLSKLHPVEQINKAGYKVYARTLWSNMTYKGHIWVVQVVIPGFETINNLIFNNPMIPLGRLRSPENIKYLMKRKSSEAC